MLFILVNIYVSSLLRGAPQRRMLIQLRRDSVTRERACAIGHT
jgi:hypothetical protein